MISTIRANITSRWAMASHIIDASQATMNASETARCSRTETGWGNCTRESVRTQKMMQIVSVNHGFGWRRNRVGMIMFHSAGNPLNQPSAVS